MQALTLDKTPELTASNPNRLTASDFNRLYDSVTDEMWDLRSTDAYFESHDRLTQGRPDLSSGAIEAIILKNQAADYAKENGFDEVRKLAFILFAAAPNYAINQARKNIYGPDKNNLEVVSNFNGLARDFVTFHPEVDKDQLSARLVESIAGTGIDNEFINDDELREAIDATIAGVRTENGLEQLFTYADIPFERGNQEEDLAHIDYLTPAGKEMLKLDVKSSVTGTGSDTMPYARIGPMHYRLLRLFGPADFKGNSFELREESLQSKAEGTRTLIEKLKKIG